MNERLKQALEKLKALWAKWTILQKGIGIGIVVVAIAAIIITSSFSSKDNHVNLFNSPYDDVATMEKVRARLERDNITTYVGTDNIIKVDNERIAKHYRSQLVSEGLMPSKKDAFSLWNRSEYTRNRMNDRVDWIRTLQNEVEANLEELDGIEKAKVILVIAEESSFVNTQDPNSASVTLWAAPGSDWLTNKHKIKGLQNIVKYSVQGLQDEYITILDGATGIEINDFESMYEADRIANQDKLQQNKIKLQNKYAASILKSLQSTFGEDRVRKVDVNIEMDTSDRSVSSHEYYGITLKPRTPGLPYDDSEVVQLIPLATEEVNKKFTGTGFNPEGPSGVEGQNPEVYADASNLIGQSEEIGKKQNNALNERTISETGSNSKWDRVSVSVNIDSVWELKKDKSGRPVFDEEHGTLLRERIDLTDKQIQEAKQIIQGAIAFNNSRADLINVTNIPFNRKAEFDAEDQAYLAKQQRNLTIMISLIGIAVVLVAFILFRIISRQIERQRRLREEQLLREQEEKRRQALWDAQQQGMEVTMSVEERHRAELQENAIAMAKEHPEDVAMLIRTWLMEE